MRCRDIMKTPVDAAAFDESIGAVAARMADARIGFMPVCDERGRILGVVTDRDIATRAFTFEDGSADRAIAHVMSPEVVACRPDEDVDRVEALMQRHQVARVLVIDEWRRPVGVVSLADLAQVDEIGAARTLRIIARREESLRDVVQRGRRS